MHLLTILIMGLLPLQNRYIGFKLVSFTHVPSSFVMQHRLGENTLVGLNFTVEYEKSTDTLYRNTGYDSTIVKTKTTYKSLGFGVDFLYKVAKRELYNGKVCGLVGINPFILRREYKTKNEIDNSEVKEKYRKIGANLKIGSLYLFHVAGVDMALEFLTDLLSIVHELNEGDFTIEDERNENLKIEGFNLTSGKLSVYLLFKM